ncbi:hypothetical protein BDR03DRAFT_966218 [Suillus americanus]|nr:hypothetical protein BDR03DRAFT_966218 [Suillus americanus]
MPNHSLSCRHDLPCPALLQSSAYHAKVQAHAPSCRPDAAPPPCDTPITAGNVLSTCRVLHSYQHPVSALFYTLHWPSFTHHDAYTLTLMYFLTTIRSTTCVL